MQLELLHKRSRQLAPVQPAVGVVDDVVAVIVAVANHQTILLILQP
jgi:hypothetical protein